MVGNHAVCCCVSCKIVLTSLWRIQRLWWCYVQMCCMFSHFTLPVVHEQACRQKQQSTVGLHVGINVF
jgi:hypothetical protein